MYPYSPLLTDLYQFTMSYGYWKLGIAEREACFYLFYRKNPFKSNYAVTCGLARVIQFLQSFQFNKDDIHYLGNLKSMDGQTLFRDEDYLNYLEGIKFSCDVDAIPEGNIVFPNEPLLRVTGPLAQCQLIETTIVNIMNYSSLIATKASRVCAATQGGSVVDFGLRRAHGPDGGIMASRAAFIGGCESTSNTLAGKLFQIPPKGTVAHSWIMAFDDELTAFKRYAEVMPHNAVLLVDTYDTITGVKKAITVGKELRKQGHELLGIRLDSGDLATLSKTARKMLDKAGFQNTKIMASGDLDEYIIAELKQKKAPIDIWGVGTKLLTAYDQPSLDTAYKLSAIKNESGQWQHKIKFSNTPEKTTNPGIQQVRRYCHQKQFIMDYIYDVKLGIDQQLPDDADHCVDLLVPIFKQGELVYKSPAIHNIRHFCIQQVKNFIESQIEEYPVKLETNLHKIKNQLLAKKNQLSTTNVTQ